MKSLQLDKKKEGCLLQSLLLFNLYFFPSFSRLLLNPWIQRVLVSQPPKSLLYNKMPHTYFILDISISNFTGKSSQAKYGN